MKEFLIKTHEDYFKNIFEIEEFYLYILYVSRTLKAFEKETEFESALDFIVSELKKESEIAKKISNYVNLYLEKESKYILENEISILHIKNPRYPKRLKQASYPPKFIFYLGNLGICTKSVAVVGTRNYDRLGERLTEHIVGLCCEKGINIVSGSAKGVDTIAQNKALKEGAKVVTVTGVGLGYFLESSQGRAYLKNKENILFITEFPLFFKGSKQSFPIRNRLIAGLSLATIMTQAPLKSGAIYTANYALSQNKPLFIPMCDYFNPNFAGNISFLKKIKENKNIHLFTDIEEFVSCLKIKIKTQTQTQKEIPNLINESEKYKMLNKDSKELLEILQNSFPNALHFDKLFQLQKNDNMMKVQNLLFELLMYDFIEELSGKYYIYKG